MVTTPAPSEAPTQKSARRRPTPKAKAQPVYQSLSPWEEEEDKEEETLVTVLYGYGKVAPTSRSYLDDFLVEGGVIKNVPKSIALCWKNGTRPDGKRPYGRVPIQAILPNDATEEDYFKAVGMSSDNLNTLIMSFRGRNAQDVITQLGPENARRLFDALNQHFTQGR